MSFGQNANSVFLSDEFQQGDDVVAQHLGPDRPASDAFESFRAHLEILLDLHRAQVVARPGLQRERIFYSGLGIHTNTHFVGGNLAKLLDHRAKMPADKVAFSFRELADQVIVSN